MTDRLTEIRQPVLVYMEENGAWVWVDREHAPSVDDALDIINELFDFDLEGDRIRLRRLDDFNGRGECCYLRPLADLGHHRIGWTFEQRPS